MSTSGRLTFLALLLVGCGGATSTSDAFPVGTYTRCFEGSDSAIAFQSTLTLVQSASTVTATVDDYGETSSFEFSLSTATSGSLASTAVLDAATGTLTYEDGVVFLTVDGSLPSDAGATPANVWLICDERQGGAPSPEPVAIAAAPSTPQLPVGQYACSSDVGTNEDPQYVSNGGGGTLTMTQSGTEVTAHYSGDTWAAGTLLLTATSATTASAEANQSLTASCIGEIVNGMVPSLTQAPLPITAGSLSAVGSTLFLSVEGTMGESSCSGALIAVTLLCSKQ